MKLCNCKNKSWIWKSQFYESLLTDFRHWTYARQWSFLYSSKSYYIIEKWVIESRDKGTSVSHLLYFSFLFNSSSKLRTSKTEKNDSKIYSLLYGDIRVMINKQINKMNRISQCQRNKYLPYKNMKLLLDTRYSEKMQTQFMIHSASHTPNHTVISKWTL